MRRLRAGVVPLVLIVLVAMSGVALGRIYAGPLLTQLMLGAAIGSVAVGVAARRLPSWLVAPVSVVALVGYGAAALWLTTRRAQLPGTLGEVLGDAARNGIPRLLTAMIPIEPRPDTVVVPLAAAWLAGLTGAELALRAERVLLGYAPPVLLYLGALYVVGPNAAPALWPTLGFVAAAAVGLAVTARPDAAADARTGTTLANAAVSPDGAIPTPADNTKADTDTGADGRVAPRVRAATGTATGVAVVVAGAALLAPAVAARVDATPVDPRRYVQPPQVDSLDENPLSRISGWALHPAQELFQVVIDNGAAVAPARPAGDTSGETAAERSTAIGGPRIRLAVLTDYDGVTWRVGATYRSAGRVLPPSPRAPGATVYEVRQEIIVGGLTGRLLPAVPTPRKVGGARVAYDPGSGTLIRPEGLTPGLRYSVTSLHEHPDFNRLTVADVPSGAAVARVLRVGDGVPEQMRRLAGQLATDNSAPYDRAVAIERFLAEHYRLVTDAPSGHAYPNLRFFLFGPRNAGGQRGTSEQFAAAFAVLARLTGLPSRVVVGFRAGPDGGTVRAADALAWPEVLFDELGWVAFDPLPTAEHDPRPVEEDVKPEPESPPPPSDEPAPTGEPTASVSATAAAAGPPSRDGTSTIRLVGGGLVGLLLVLGGFAVAVIALRGAQRRRRLQRGSPGRRIRGAWLELADALRLAGRPAAGHLSAAEVVAHARRVATEASARPRRTATEATTQPGAGTEVPTQPGRAGSEPPIPVGRTAGDTAAVRAPVPPVDDLASLVNRAAFAPVGTSPEQADRAGARVLAYATALRSALPWWRRLLWSLHPGPLYWRR